MPATEFVRPAWSSPAGVASQLVTAPTAEPLTLAEAKLRAGLDWATGDPRDALMESFVKAARQKVEADTGLALLQQTRRVTIAAPAGTPIPLPAQTIPTQSITAIDGSVPPVLDGSGQIPADYAGTFDVVAGWPTPAALAAEAPLLVQAVGLLVAHMATMGRDVVTQPTNAFEIPYGYDDSVAPYRLLRIV